MACSESHFEAIKELENIRCIVCGAIKVTPVTLTCGHSFCLKCVERGSVEETANISCSKCQAVTVLTVGQQLIPSEELTYLITQSSLIYSCVECDKLTCFNTKCVMCGSSVCLKCQLFHTCGAKQQLCKVHQKPLDAVCTYCDVVCCIWCFVKEPHNGHTAALVTDVGNKSVVAKLNQEVDSTDELFTNKSGIMKARRDREEAAIGNANENFDDLNNKFAEIREISFKRRECCDKFLENFTTKLASVRENKGKNQGESQHNVVSNYIDLSECRDLKNSLHKVKFDSDMENELQNLDNAMEKVLVYCDKIREISEIPIIFRLKTFTLDAEYETKLVKNSIFKINEVKKIDFKQLGISQIGHLDVSGSLVAFMDKEDKVLEVWSHNEGKIIFCYNVSFYWDKCMLQKSVMLVKICGDYIIVSSAACLWAVDHKQQKVVHHRCLKTAENQVNIVSLSKLGSFSVRVVNQADNSICKFKLPGFESEEKVDVACNPGKVVSTIQVCYALVVNQGNMEVYYAHNGRNTGRTPLPCEGDSGILPVSEDWRYIRLGNNYSSSIITTRVGGKHKLNISNIDKGSVLAEWVPGYEVEAVAWLGADKPTNRGEFNFILISDPANNLLRVVKVSLM